MSHRLGRVLFLRMECSSGQSAQRRKRSTNTEKVKQKWLTLRLECLLLSFARTASKLSATAARRKKSSSLSGLESVVVHWTPFYLSGRRKIEAPAFEFTWRKRPVDSHTGDGKHRVVCRCGRPSANPVAGCHNQELQSLVWQPLKEADVAWWGRSENIGRTWDRHAAGSTNTG